MALTNKIQPLLPNDESCRNCVEGSLVSGWTRVPHLFAIVRSSLNNHGLVIFSYPGIGSSEVTVRPIDAVPFDKNFKFMLLNTTQVSATHKEFQLQLTSGAKVYVAEFTNTEATEKFIMLITQLVSENSSSPQYDWLKKYTAKEDAKIENWPLSELAKTANNPTDPLQYTPLAFDADDDILSFDPLAPPKKLIDPLTAAALERDKQQQDAIDGGVNEPLDLSDFDPLTQNDVKKENKMSAELLRRSREVVSNRALAGKSWLERTFSQGLQLNETTKGSSTTPTATTATATTTYEERNSSKPSDESSDEPYDEIDNLDVINARNENMPETPPPVLGTRNSSIFKGMRARENYIKIHLTAREKEFTELHPMTIFVGTWNVNGQLATETLVPWLRDVSTPPDVYAIGFQELDLSAEALVFNDSSRERSWLDAIENGLPTSAHYFRLRVIRLVGMMLVVYIQQKHEQQVYDAEAEHNGTGIMGMMGNKGGVSVRFQLHNSSICFVNSHLAAHLAEFERRNQDYREVYSKLKFTLFQPPLSIGDHDMIFWLGDLNYRFDDLEPDQVKGLIEKQNFEKLLAHDQLQKQRKLEKCFNGFDEGPLNFSPTYKYDPGTDNWDTSEKGRAPAWCDRVLWKGKNIQQLAYRSHPLLKLSDHKPVSGLFSVGIKVVDKAKERRVFEEIVRKLDKRENDSLPQVKLDKHEFQFGDITFMEEKTHTLPIINCGQSPVEFEFIPKLDETEVCKPWLKINPQCGFIYPGDFFEIELTISVDKLSAPMVTIGNCKLDEILVLHLVDGKDFFVPINGTYLPSVFGSSLEALARIYGPIRQVPMDSLIRLENKASTFDKIDIQGFDQTEPLDLPKELWLLVDHIHKHGMKVENILLQSGTDVEIVRIRHHLDNGVGGKIPGSLYSIGEALLLFLEALPEPVIPYKFHQRCHDASNNYVLCKQIITQLPECHANVFRYLTSFLRELLRHSLDNKLDARMLATVFGSILLRPPLEHGKNLSKRAVSQIAQKKARFVFHFLINDFRE
eukprot:TCONS_00018387-protein